MKDEMKTPEGYDDSGNDWGYGLRSGIPLAEQIVSLFPEKSSM
jgi:hypothetical protein